MQFCVLPRVCFRVRVFKVSLIHLGEVYDIMLQHLTPEVYAFALILQECETILADVFHHELMASNPKTHVQEITSCIKWQRLSFRENERCVVWRSPKPDEKQ